MHLATNPCIPRMGLVLPCWKKKEKREREREIKQSESELAGPAWTRGYIMSVPPGHGVAL